MYIGRNHTWFTLNQEGVMTLGVGLMAARALGQPDNICLLSEGKEVRKGQPCFRLGRGNRQMTLRAPVDGIIDQVNVSALKDSSTVSMDPFGRGWIYRIEPRGEISLEEFISGAKADGWLKSEISRLRDFLAGRTESPALAGATLQDGGMPVDGFGEQLDDEHWHQLLEDFLGLETGN